MNSVTMLFFEFSSVINCIFNVGEICIGTTTNMFIFFCIANNSPFFHTLLVINTINFTFVS